MSQPKKIYKRAFLTEKEREKSPEFFYSCIRHLPEMTDLEICWIPEAHSGRHQSGSEDYTQSLSSEHLLPGTGRIKFSSSPGWSSAQLSALGQALHRQNNAAPGHKGDTKLDFGSLTQHSTTPTNSYHLYDRNPILSVLLAVTILEKSLGMINAKRK